MRIKQSFGKLDNMKHKSGSIAGLITQDEHQKVLTEEDDETEVILQKVLANKDDEIEVRL